MSSNSGKPLISIIVPFYNVERYARRCIESLKAQTLKEIEIILVDDGSPDNCGAIIDEYAAADHRIKAIHLQNCGVSAARNAGLAAATANVIGFVDSDDWVEPEMYERMLDEMKATGSDIVVCGISYDFKNKTKYEKAPQFKEPFTVGKSEALELLFDDKIFHNYAWDKIFAKHTLSEGFPVGVRLEDIRILIRYFANAGSISYIPFVGYHYIQRSGSCLHSNIASRFIYYLEARISQLDFLKEQGLLPEKWLDYSCRIIIEGIREARDMARNLPWDNEIKQGFAHILSLIEPFRSDCFDTLPPKTKRRWKLLKNHPRLFYHSMRIGKKFQLKNNYKQRNYEYYE